MQAAFIRSLRAARPGYRSRRVPEGRQREKEQEEEEEEKEQQQEPGGGRERGKAECYLLRVGEEDPILIMDIEFPLVWRVVGVWLAASFPC
ncbi:hypothetical protein E2C01_058031 [Portunus trituberculatus]|uniref:Uncharacterized protein n=1 Tax=Portunus trituberculatus TaxID=210409 RepID=A0A5B7H1K3_PORTR|nr:hypothetical protein [Portunus trituberculatus]